MLEMFSYSFLREAFVANIAMAFFAPLLGVFMVLRHQSLLSDMLSHVSLAGVALGLLFAINPTWTTLVVVALVAVFMEYLRKIYSHYTELAIAMMMSAALALALIIMNATASGTGISIDQYLFGSILTINFNQIVMLIVLAVVIVLAFILFQRPLYVMTFNEDTAFVEGLPVRAISLIFNVVTGIAIALMIPIVGALLVSAIMVLPAAIALLVGRSFKAVIVIAIIVAMIGLQSGLFISYYANTPASAAVVLAFIVIFLLAALAKRLARR